jgi:hypothetical protein
MRREWAEFRSLAARGPPIKPFCRCAYRRRLRFPVEETRLIDDQVRRKAAPQGALKEGRE